MNTLLRHNAAHGSPVLTLSFDDQTTLDIKFRDYTKTTTAITVTTKAVERACHLLKTGSAEINTEINAEINAIKIPKLIPK